MKFLVRTDKYSILPLLICDAANDARSTAANARVLVGGEWGFHIKVGFGVHFAREWVLQLPGRFQARKWPVHFTQAFAVCAISDCVLWSEGAKLEIFDVIHEGILLRLFDPFVSRPEPP